MKSARILPTALLLLLGTTVSASDWAMRVEDVVPANITLTKVEEIDGAVIIVGQAKNNSDISALMRAVEKSELGDADLQQIKRTDEISTFTLLVKARR